MSDGLRATLQQTLGDGYTLERELGGGGMSRVFVARENALGRDVVVKVLAPELSASVSAERFTREIATAARLQQANILPVLSAGTSDGTPYYTMPFVRGESLRTHLANGVAMTLADKLSVLRDVARALAYAHGQGVIHRDIKPDNILLSSGAAVLMDFGIAKAISAARTSDDDGGATADGTLTQIGSSVGTPAYMAPEQAVGERIDPRADVYAWGVVAYELLSGAHPFAGRTGTAQLIAAHLAELPQPLGVRAVGVPPAVATLVMQCLAKDAGERPADGGDLDARLSRMATADATPVALPLSRHANRTVLGVLFASAAAAGAALWLSTRPSPAVMGPVAQTVVVLPFENLGAAADAYFAEGMTEEIAGRLARVPGLQVVARASVQRFRGSTKSPQEIARELGAAYALSGSIRWARVAGASGFGANDSTMVRIVPSLIRVQTGDQLWGEPLQQRLTDVFKVQTDVAERVASALSLTLGAEVLADVRRPESASTEARDAQLLGRFFLKQRGIQNLQRAVAEFRRAIAIDSSYARAWAGYAEAVGYLPVYGDTMSVAQANREAANAARRAIALDSLLADAHTALATTYEHEQRFSEGMAQVERALALDPGSAAAWKERGLILLAMGRVADAEAPLRRALALEPLLPFVHLELGMWHSAVGHGDSAVFAVRRGIALDSGNATFHMIGEVWSGLANRLRDARAHCARAGRSELACDQLWGSVTGGRDVARARSALDTMQTVGKQARSIPVGVQAAMYAQLTSVDSAFARLTAAVRVKDPNLYAVVNLPVFAELRRDPRWDALMRVYRAR